jgi:DNA-binding MarR family transcriptional regulator
MSTVTSEEVEALLEAYPQIFLACHRRHVLDPVSDRELSRNQVDILQHLDSIEPTSVGELAEHMGVSISTMSLNASRLERDGYLFRSRDAEDGRVVHLRLTGAGERVREADEVLDPDRVAVLLEGLSREERARGLAGLTLLAAAARSMEPRRAWSSREGGAR